MPEVAIVGAGIAGLCLALALAEHSIKSTIYDLHESSFWTVGGLMIAPNALRILDRLGLFETLESNGFSFENMEFRNERDELIELWSIGDEVKFGYKCCRLVRPILLDVLRKAAQKSGIVIHYGKRFSRVVEETSTGIVFELTDGSEVRADVLVGADGIHSSVRPYIHPVVKTIYTGAVSILATVDHEFRTTDNSAKIPQTTLFNGKTGTILVLPQLKNGTETNLGKQWPFPEQDRKGWDALMADKHKLYEMFVENTEEWPPCVQELLKRLRPDDMYIWPFYSLPDLPTWTSDQEKRVIIVGDAAHAIPPSAGQGACQAIEDAWSLAETLSIALTSSNGTNGTEFAKRVTKWQQVRRQRVHDARVFTMKLNNMRLPLAQREKLSKDQVWSAKDDDLIWLYGTGRKEVSS